MRQKPRDLRTILDGLEDTKLEYVFARSRHNKTTDALREIGLSRATFYNWPDREELDELAQELKRRRMLRVEMIIEDAAEDAATVKVGGLKSRKEHIKQSVASEILDRTIGAPTKKLDIQGDTDLHVRLQWEDADTDIDPSEAA